MKLNFSKTPDVVLLLYCMTSEDFIMINYCDCTFISMFSILIVDEWGWVFKITRYKYLFK